MFGEVKRIFPSWILQIVSENIQRNASINYLGYKVGLQNIWPQKVKIRRDWLWTSNDCQKLLEDIN